MPARARDAYETSGSGSEDEEGEERGRGAAGEPGALATVHAEVEARRHLLRVQLLVRRRHLHRQRAQRHAPRAALHDAHAHEQYGGSTPE